MAAADSLDTLEESIEAIQAAGRLLQKFFAVLNRAAVMRREQEEANRFGLVTFEQFAEWAGASGFADFCCCLRGGAGRASGTRSARITRRSPADFSRFGGGLHQSVVQPVLGLRLAVSTFALRDLVFVVRENQVEPAAVDVERLA